MNNNFDIITTKLSLMIGVAGWVGLTQANDIAKLVLSCISIISFGIIIIINFEKAKIQVKKWFKK